MAQIDTTPAAMSWKVYAGASKQYVDAAAAALADRIAALEEKL